MKSHGRRWAGAQVELKGRLNLDKAAEFFANLRRSRTRTASAALLRCDPDRHLRTFLLALGQRGTALSLSRMCAPRGRTQCWPLEVFAHLRAFGGAPHFWNHQMLPDLNQEII